ncbi:alpha/beta fold hydrolase [Vitiosangium sp. GDMCC 1.1324]|uniref:alpha/beta fold hydrolase n=1 Tax=Vitiosangium sp. (strain GDMCC 1.1324) TaxID=2138576 RepID=UPI000D3CFBDD|nr:alpha/beta hydrolase [Vitiosangium sp. GDMCC 1.1324]PTL83896.1 alpha/beta hydrolase [Vitiosangium sp. GDMCC 1.1324]
MPPFFESLTIDAHGLALHVRQHNAAGTPTVVFLHGWLDHSHSFDFVAEHLPDSWRLLLLDFRGMGRSTWLPSHAHYQFSDYLVDVDAVVRATGQEAVHLVGHSLGGIVATAYAAARPSRVLSVNLIESLGPSGGPPENALARLRGFLEDQERAPNRKRYPSVEAAAARLRDNTALPEHVALHMARHGTEPVEDGFVFTFDPVHRRRFGSGYDEAQWLAISSAVTCPMQLILGSEGLRFDGERTRERLAALRTLRPLVTVPGGHHVHLEQPEAVARVLRELIAPTP